MRAKCRKVNTPNGAVRYTQNGAGAADVILILYDSFREDDSMVCERQVEPLQKNVNDGDLNEARMASLAIWGMDCHNCVTRVRNSLLRLDGVVSADIDLELGLAFVDYVPAKTDPHALILAVASAGDDGRHNYQAALIT